MSDLKESESIIEDLPLEVNTMRIIGKKMCDWEGSPHYLSEDVQPIDLIASIDELQGFALGSAIKYASRYNKTKNKKDLIKAVDFLQILLGYLAIKETRQKEM